MTTRVLIPPTTEPITMVEVEAHLRVGDSPADAVHIESLISVAREWCEEYTRHAIGEQTIEEILPCFPTANNGRIALRIPVRSIVSIKYYDTSNTLVTMANSPAEEDYIFVSQLGWIHPPVGETWPLTAVREDAVVVQFTAGHSTDVDSPNDYPLPKPLYMGMLLLIGDLYENREAQHVGITAMQNATLLNLLHIYRQEIGI